MTRIINHRLFWPGFCLLALVVLNTVVRPGFIKITLRDGELYGAPIDIFRQSAPLMLVERTAYTQSGVALEYARDLFRGDRTRVVVWTSELAGEL